MRLKAVSAPVRGQTANGRRIRAWLGDNVSAVGESE